MMHEQVCCYDEAANHQLPIASLPSHPNSFHRAMFNFNTKYDTDLLLYSLSRFQCDSHTVHMLTQ